MTKKTNAKPVRKVLSQKRWSCDRPAGHLSLRFNHRCEAAFLIQPPNGCGMPRQEVDVNWKLTRTHPISGGGAYILASDRPSPFRPWVSGMGSGKWRAWQDSNLHDATVRGATYWSHRRDEPLGYHQLSGISERVRWPSFSTVSPDPAPESCSKVFYHPFSPRW